MFPSLRWLSIRQKRVRNVSSNSTGEVREWYQYGGQPHHFKVLSDNPSLVNSNLDLFLKLSLIHI